MTEDKLVDVIVEFFDNGCDSCEWYDCSDNSCLFSACEWCLSDKAAHELAKKILSSSDPF